MKTFLSRVSFISTYNSQFELVSVNGFSSEEPMMISFPY